MEQGPIPPKRIRLYITLQALTLAGCWIWFALLWTVAFFGYSLGDIEWWVLVAAATAGLYGLRPNLERAIDTAWLQGVKSSTALAERAAQLKPIKRRIDIFFSVVVLALFVAAVALWLIFGALGVDIGGA
jgi:hypothetical protein